MPDGDSFVQRQSDRLVLGNDTFRIVGANIYYFAYSAEADQIRLLDLASDFGLNVLRIWALNDFINLPPNPSVPADADVCFQFLNPGAGAPELREGSFGLERLDRAIKLAGGRGIRLILTLTNHNPDYGGIPQYQRWLGFANLNDFYRDASAIVTFQNWVQAIVGRQNTVTNLSYADDPTILAWEIANEPRCPSDPSGTEALTDWLREMSAFIGDNLLGKSQIMMPNQLRSGPSGRALPKSNVRFVCVGFSYKRVVIWVSKVVIVVDLMNPRLIGIS